MRHWVALLRGVNVGGITITSAALRDLFAELGLQHVKTVLASGNVAFTTSGVAAEELTTRIQTGLRERFGYEAWIVLSDTAHIALVCEAFPFDAEDATRQPWVIFGSDTAALDELAAAAADLDPVVDPVRRGEGVLYWNPVTGTTTDTPFAKLLAKVKYKSTTTNRNLRTLRKVLAAARD